MSSETTDLANNTQKIIFCRSHSEPTIQNHPSLSPSECSQRYKNTNIMMDIATYRLNWPRELLSENVPNSL